jgi:hypothetical protein
LVPDLDQRLVGGVEAAGQEYRDVDQGGGIVGEQAGRVGERDGVTPNLTSRSGP